MQLLPDDLSLELIAICHHAERTGRWPLQAMTGLIAAIAKMPGAHLVSHYRPICVLSLVYRILASIRSRQMLQHLSRLLDSDVVGNMPGRSTASVWFLLQRSIERAHLYKNHTTGLVIDLVKAFNLLPRVPVWMMAKVAGFDNAVIKAWAGGLTLMRRRFKLRSSGPAILSTTGYPEGDAMSVVAMALVATSFHCWMKTQVPGCRPISYVDNWQLVASDVPTLLQGRDALIKAHVFCH